MRGGASQAEPDDEENHPGNLLVYNFLYQHAEPPCHNSTWHRNAEMRDFVAAFEVPAAADDQGQHHQAKPAQHCPRSKSCWAFATVLHVPPLSHTPLSQRAPLLPPQRALRSLRVLSGQSVEQRGAPAPGGSLLRARKKVKTMRGAMCSAM